MKQVCEVRVVGSIDVDRDHLQQCRSSGNAGRVDGDDDVGADAGGEEFFEGGAHADDQRPVARLGQQRHVAVQRRPRGDDDGGAAFEHFLDALHARREHIRQRVFYDVGLANLADFYRRADVDPAAVGGVAQLGRGLFVGLAAGAQGGRVEQVLHFFAEKIVEEESIHLSDWPEVNKKLIDEEIEQEISVALQIIEDGLRERDKIQMGLKWPLAKAVVVVPENQKIRDEIQKIISKQINVKEIEIKSGKQIKVKLDTKITPELEAEGYARVLSRRIQAARKKQGLVKNDFIEIEISDEVAKIVESQKDFIKERTNAKAIFIEENGTGKKFNYSEEGQIKGKKFKISFNKI